MDIRWFHVGIALLAGAGAGWMARGSEKADHGESDAVHAARANGQRDELRREQFGPTGTSLRTELRRAQPSMLPGLVRRALEGADPAERMALVLEMFSAVDASNAAAVMAAFSEISKDTGRTHMSEWMLACYLTGQRGGEPMMERVLAMGLRENYAEAHETFFGWASADPELAEAWLDRLDGEDAGAKSELMRGVMGGLAIKDPEAAMKRVAELEEPARSKCLGDVTFHLVQGEGIERAIDWMMEVNAAAGAEDQEFAAKLREDVMGKMFWAASGRGGGSHLAEQLERIHGSTPIDPQRVVQEAGRMRGTDGLEMVNRLAEGSILADPLVRDEAILAALGRARQGNPSQTEAWLRKHPDSVVAAVAGAALPE